MDQLGQLADCPTGVGYFRGGRTTGRPGTFRGGNTAGRRADTNCRPRDAIPLQPASPSLGLFAAVEASGKGSYPFPAADWGREGHLQDFQLLTAPI